jgi:hypothetical protein
MIRKSVKRFSEKIMLDQKGSDHGPRISSASFDRAARPAGPIMLRSIRGTRRGIVLVMPGPRSGHPSIFVMTTPCINHTPGTGHALMSNYLRKSTKVVRLERNTPTIL